MFEKPNHWGNKVYAYVYDIQKDAASEGLKQWPGNEMTLYDWTENQDLISNNTYYIGLYRPYFNENTRVIFTDGTHQSTEPFKDGFPLIREGLYTQNGIKALCIWTVKWENNKDIYYDDCRSTYAAIYYETKPSWGYKAYAHYQIGKNSWTEKPVEMRHQNYDTNEFALYVDVGNDKDITVAFFDGESEWDNNNGQNFKVQPLTDVVLKHTI
ncbi:hypothetical protein BCR32DRAFT_327992 [Anaeromyces robustus]|uniref:Carbohydrate binding module family 25 domain-containing protein n=1 Tax=Anaeromyces robustus TaxID=1754192 RepID=A0A1Y1X1U5_9FUNG|nr:hypothetical protein BCR32DRAFT_327992 [Anaeromyces robustus]|eukprot:ORX79743.1 hypothetical protein BCR32DRAFT_327992 [Anaeromyces robustus]